MGTRLNRIISAAVPLVVLGTIFLTMYYLGCPKISELVDPQHKNGVEFICRWLSHLIMHRPGS